MLQIGSPKFKLLKEKIDDKEIDGVHFNVESIQGLTLKVRHNANDDISAKTIIKKLIANDPEFKNAYTNIQMIDENGRIL